ncbi:TRAP transporter substrate-binding protein DctP [Thalassovita sp.]|jgi:TRAP-type C4-dicarboxylate transport system substrate-binding protein|uniref:TRAP transporter substrate-binding protein DctP n=1 Tax=Thalassovita sp. TaxID=1979401 RepID=UPI003B58D3F7
MRKYISRAAIAAVSVAFATEAMATEWSVSLWGKRRAFTEHVEKLAELVSAKTNGEFTMNISYGGLSKNKENLDGISIGAFEMAQFCAGYHRDKNPSITVLELPFLGVASLEQEIELSMAVYQHPATVKDLERWNATLLMPSPLPQYNIVGMGDAPATLEDFVGLTVRATGGIGAAMKTIGAVPTSMSASEVRQAMDSGVIKAVSFAPHAHMSFGTIENGTWWTTNLNPGTVNCPVVVNTEALEDLPADHREALLSSIPEALSHYVDNYNNKTMSAWGPALDERGIKRVTFSDAELAAFEAAAAAPAAQAWIEQNSARGLPAQDLYDLVTGMIAAAK